MSVLKKRTRTNFALLCFFILFSAETLAQTTPHETSILFYNVENLFDIKDDPHTNDEEFTPKGERRWTYKRFNQKIQNLSKVVLSASGWMPPTLVAFCEIENRYVLEQLLKNTPLKSTPYQIIHKESPDSRGIDVALLYNQRDFYPLEYKTIPIRLENDSVLDSREILYVSGIIKNTDTLHVFANHWPSRYSGLLESQPLRNLAAQTLRSEVNILQKKTLNPRIIILGDFNDQPGDESLSVWLNALRIPDQPSKIEKNQLYNLSFDWLEQETGTIKYQSQWSVFDQIIVSGNLLEQNNKIVTSADQAEIVRFPFLLENDDRYGGLKTNRTYVGFRYNGGFSDHLPVLLNLQLNP